MEGRRVHDGDFIARTFFFFFSRDRKNGYRLTTPVDPVFPDSKRRQKYSCPAFKGRVEQTCTFEIAR